MPTRTVNLKFILGRSSASQPLRQDIWTTHAAANEAVAEFEGVLLLCRADEYVRQDDQVVPAQKVRPQALSWARRVQQQNGFPAAGTDEQVLSALRGFYEMLVPAVALDDKGNPLQGDARQSRGIAGPMMSAASSGATACLEKVLDPPPAWVAEMQQEQEGWRERSQRWLASPEAKRLLSATGRAPKWKKLLPQSLPWQQAFVDHQQQLRRQAGGSGQIVRLLKEELGLLPMLAPPIARRLRGSRAAVSRWDYMALRLAVAHLLSWESWNHRVRGEYRRIQSRCEAARLQVAAHGLAVDRLRQYERQRHEQLKRVALADDERPYRIGARSIRSWEQVRTRWLSPACRTEADRAQVLRELQGKLRGRFGDPDLFRWLAREASAPVWRDADPLPDLVRLNALEALLARRRQQARYTPPDARTHPRWAQYENAAQSGNLPFYRLCIEEGRPQVELVLLRGSGPALEEVRSTARLAPSGQFAGPAFTGTGKQQRIAWRCGYEDFAGSPRSSELLLRRRHMENRSPARLAEGEIGDVWLKLVLDLDSKAPPGWLDARGRLSASAALGPLQKERPARKGALGQLARRLRVLSVDLGLRSFAACSVFELAAGRPRQGMAYPAALDGDLWAVHERSFLLRLPGESPDAPTLAARRQADQELRALRREIACLRDLLRLGAVEDKDLREAGLEALRQSLGDEGQRTLALADLAGLDALTAADAQTWQEALGAIHRAAECRLGALIAEWRARTRPRPLDGPDRLARRRYAGGKSAWAIQYLTAVRRLLQSWSLHGRLYAQIRRLDREKAGVFAAGLLEHLNGLREDRIKTGVDLIVQAARGCLFQPPSGWTRRFQPCRLILLENLSRYLFRTDRPRRENSQLMRWAHRRILSECQMQAELYGIAVWRVSPGFSSRFHARTGAPGLRVRQVTAADLASPWFADILAERVQRAGLPAGALAPGALLPDEAGESFATLDGDGRLVVLNADLNAAQNLQRRFWLRFGEAYRVPVVATVPEGQGAPLWYPAADRKRQRGALAAILANNGYGRFESAADGDGWILRPTSASHWRAAVGQASAGEGQADDDTEVDAESPDLDAPPPLEPERRATMFRDPSGLLLPPDRWYPTREFWSRVEAKLCRALAAQAAVRDTRF